MSDTYTVFLTAVNSTGRLHFNFNITEIDFSQQLIPNIFSIRVQF